MLHNRLLLLLLPLLSLQATAQSPDNPLGLKPHHITASVTDLDRAVAWYQSMLGFDLKERGHHGESQFAELAVPGFGVALVKEPAGTSTTAPAPRIAPYWMHIVFSVPDPDRVFKLLKKRGAIVTTRQNPADGPITSFLVNDSEGNEIEILREAQTRAQ